MEKTITFTGLYAKFTKNFDTFGKMLGSLLQKTQVSEAGLQPVWKATITLKATTQNEIQITAYDQDLTENEYIGTAKLKIDSLKPSGNQSIAIIGEDGKSIGDVFFSYQVQQPKAALTNPEASSQNNIKKSVEKKPTVVQPQIEKPAVEKQSSNSIKITQISAKFTKNFDTFGKMQPLLVFKLGKSEDKTEIYKGIFFLIKDSKDDVKWAKNINFGFDKETDLEIKGYDEDMTENEYIGNSIVNLKSLSKSGKHTVQMLGQDTKSIGTISFNYQITGLFPDEKIAPVQKSVAQPAPKPQVVEKPVPKPIEPVKVQQKQKIETPVQQEIKRVVVVQKQNDISQKELDRKSINLNNSMTKTGQLNKSRDSLKLPLIGDVAKNYGDSNQLIYAEIYEKQSSSTLQKSILVYSMPKASRFHNGPKYVGEPSYYVDSCFKPNATRGTGFGFGNKKQFPEWLERNMKENPAPGAYFEQPKSAQVRSRGPTFGISHKFYEKVTIPKEKSPQRTIKSNPRLKAIMREK